MRILALEAEPFHTLRYVLGSEAWQASALLPFCRATVEGLSHELEAIVAAGDLQGIEQTADRSRPVRLLGEVVAFELEQLRARGELPPKEKTAVLLVGDLCPDADEGDVRSVWFALADACRWVAGVAGNHDAFGQCTSVGDARIALGRPELHLLDESLVKLDGLTIGGLSGIISNSDGAWIRSESDFVAAMARLAQQGPDLLISHDGPNVAGTALSGWPSVRRALEAAPPTLLIRGHDAWRTPLATLANGTQILNVEGRVVVLVR